MHVQLQPHERIDEFQDLLHVSVRFWLPPLREGVSRGQFKMNVPVIVETGIGKNKAQENVTGARLVLGNKLFLDSWQGNLRPFLLRKNAAHGKGETSSAVERR